MNPNAEEIFNQYIDLPEKILNKTFKNPTQIAHQRRLEKSDLIQFCYMGLWRACCEFKDNRGAKFTSFAISHIKWSLYTKMSEASSYCRRYKNEQRHSPEENLVELIDLDSNAYDEKTYHDILPSDTNVVGEAEGNYLYEKIVKKLNPRQYKILRLRYQDYTLREIGKMLNCSRETVRLELLKMENMLLSHYEEVV